MEEGERGVPRPHTGAAGIPVIKFHIKFAEVVVI